MSEKSRTILEILSLSPEERQELYGVSGGVRKDIYGNTIDIGKVWIKRSAYLGDIEDNFTNDDMFSGYSTYSFSWNRSDKEQITRTDNASTPQLWTMPYYIIGHLAIDFDMMSIDDYRRIMKLIYGRNCFKVKAYDDVFDRMIIIEMYFYPDEMPKLFTLANHLHGMGASNGDCIDLIAVRGHKTEMVGTGNDNAQGRYFPNND